MKGSSGVLFLQRGIGSLCSALIFTLLFASLSATAAELPLVRIAHSAFNDKIAALWIGVDKGFFKKHRVEVEVLQIRSSAPTMAALASGELQMTYTNPGIVLGAKAGAIDIALFAGLVNKAQGEIISSPAIKSPENLKGKRIGVQTIGSGVWGLTMFALDYWGLEAKRDKIFIQSVGDESALAQALLVKNIEAAYLSYPLANDLKKKGFHSLVDLMKIGSPYQGLGLAAHRAYVQRNPDTVDGVLRGVLESVAFIKNPANRPAVADNLARHMRLSRPADIELSCELLPLLYDYDIRPSLEGTRTMHRLLSSINPQMQKVRAEDVIDDGPAQRLMKSSFYTEILGQTKKL